MELVDKLSKAEMSYLKTLQKDGINMKLTDKLIGIKNKGGERVSKEFIDIFSKQMKTDRTELVEHQL